MINKYWKNNQLKKIVIISLFLIPIININFITFANGKKLNKNKIQKTKIIWKNNLQEIRLNRKNKHLEELKNAKKIFEIKKEEILNKLKSWKITKEEAHKQIIEEKEKIINSSKRKLNDEKEKLKNDNLFRLKLIIKEKLNTKLIWLKKLSKKEKEVVLEKFIEKLNIELKWLTFN